MARQSQKQDRRIGLGRRWCFLYARRGTWDTKANENTSRKLGHLVTFGSDPGPRGSLGLRDTLSRPSFGERASGTKRGWLLVEAPSMHLTVLRTGWWFAGSSGLCGPFSAGRMSCARLDTWGKGILRVPQLDARASVHRGPSSKLHPSLATSLAVSSPVRKSVSSVLGKHFTS